ncbi:hypothetical protein [Neotabrizicola sp. sgz301269]|uniref:hypothetical protein n=1 Tax=Neotabrizicola sp. sgz301269 TaxID=3276282 RepID=UPI0037700A38
MEGLVATAGRTDALIKPDMRAVLARTHLSVSSHGFMLPIFEALSNSFDGIEQRFGEDATRKGRIHLRFDNVGDPDNFFVSISDNGIGLNDDNYTSFRTPFSGFKLSKRGRGFGRFIAFKVFSRIHYSSRFLSGVSESVRTFRFDIERDEEIVFHEGEPDFEDFGVCLELDDVKNEWRNLISELTTDDIKGEIGSHFLPYFLSRGLPQISLQFGEGEPENITYYFKSLFVPHDTGEFDCEIDGVTCRLNYALTKIPKTRQFKSHSLLVAAADRIVGHPRDLSNKLGAAHFTDRSDEKYIIVAVVRGDAFETRLNDSRTSIDLPAKAIESIVGSVCSAIQEKEQVQVEKIKEGQSRQLTLTLQENPILRLGLKGQTLDEYVSRKPNNWGPEEFVQDLALSRFRATGDLLKQIAEASNNQESYIEKIHELAGKIDAGKKEALAEYVLHRKSIIDLLDASRRFNASDKRGSEDEVHSLIFRRFSDSTNVEYFEHNLWLIDDALAFVPYVSSDRTMHGKRRQQGDKVTDLLFFDDSMVLGDEDGTSLAIVEFKKPSRNDYKFGDAKTDPVTQVIDTLEKALASGGISKVDGTHISFAGVTRRQAFIVADITSSLIPVLRRHDFKNNYNPKIWYRYRDQEQVLIQVYGYDTLVETAKKRNQAFCTILLDE